MSAAVASLTVVAVVNDRVPDTACLERYVTVLKDCAIDFDLVLVANGVDVDAALALKTLVAATPDTMAVFLAEPVHDDLARLVGGEHAVGDYVLFCDLMDDDPALLPPLFAPLREGYDLVVADRGPEISERSGLGRTLVALYGWLYRRVAGVPLNVQPTGLRVLSRAAALYVSGRPDAELLVRARWVGNGFPAVVVPLPPGTAQASRRIRYSWSKGIGLLPNAFTRFSGGGIAMPAIGHHDERRCGACRLEFGCKLFTVGHGHQIVFPPVHDQERRIVSPGADVGQRTRLHQQIEVLVHRPTHQGRK